MALLIELDRHVSNGDIPPSSATRGLVENAAELPVHAAHLVEDSRLKQIRELRPRTLATDDRIAAFAQQRSKSFLTLPQDALSPAVFYVEPAVSTTMSPAVHHAYSCQLD